MEPWEEIYEGYLIRSGCPFNLLDSIELTTPGSHRKLETIRYDGYSAYLASKTQDGQGNRTKHADGPYGQSEGLETAP